MAAACREHRIDCVFIGPEAPLAAGVADALRAEGIATIGPGRSPARLESSKAFSKAFLVRNGIPTAEAATFRDADGVRSYLAARRGQRLVVKKSGLAAGKGVLVSADHDELAAFAAAAVRDDEVLVEECLEGWEVSVFGLSDGTDHLVLPPCTDFKRAHDGDQGPNTGGMGSICPVPPADAAFMARVRTDIVDPVYAALAREGLAYPGVLYFGLMVTASGPKVLEFNVRFGDPETQVLLPVLDADLGELVEAMAAGTLGGLALAGRRAARHPARCRPRRGRREPRIPRALREGRAGRRRSHPRPPAKHWCSTPRPGTTPRAGWLRAAAGASPSWDSASTWRKRRGGPTPPSSGCSSTGRGTAPTSERGSRTPAPLEADSDRHPLPHRVRVRPGRRGARASSWPPNAASPSS